MPVLKKIVIQDFRNIALQELEFSPNINCISGGNGEGKTNLLDAIWYLSLTKSASALSDRFNITHGKESLGLSGLYEMEDGRSVRICIRAGRDGEKKVTRDDKAYGRISDHIGLLPIVMVSPSDSAMVSDSGEERRRFVNSVLSQTDSSYLRNLQTYNRLLAQRNTLLKSASVDAGLLDVLDERLDTLAAPISEARKVFCESLNPIVRNFYRLISDEKEDVSITYRTDLEERPLVHLLKEQRNRDLALRYTSSGIQRDDFVFGMDGFPIRKCGSQGQQKSFLVALKFAQYEIMKENCACRPILLLDDLFDKLDMQRVANLLKMVSGNDFGQIFLSDSNKVRTESIIDGITSDRKYYIARGGAFSCEQD